MDLLSTIFNTKNQTTSSIKTLNNTISQMGIDNISFISMRGYKWGGDFRIEGEITLKKEGTEVKQKFNASDFVDLFNQIVSFCRNM